MTDNEGGQGRIIHVYEGREDFPRTAAAEELLASLGKALTAAAEATDYGPDGPGPDGWYKLELFGHVTHKSPGWFDGFAIRASGPPS